MPFRGVRERVWEPTGLSTAAWLLVPVREIFIGDLFATQDGVYLTPLLTREPGSACGDPFPHVILFRGDLYLEDGHHRVLRAALNGQTTVQARVWCARARTEAGESPKNFANRGVHIRTDRVY